MQAPPTRTPSQDRDLIVIPEVHTPLQQWVVLTIAGAAVIALIVGVLGGYFWQRGGLRERDAALVAATARVVTAEDEARTSAVQISILESRVSDLRTVLNRSRARTVVVGASRAELRRQLADARGELDRAQARIAALTATPTDDGQHIATVVVVGATQEPPVVVLDLGRWFTGARARRAAIADGSITPGDVLPNGRYLRNATPGWRTVPLDPTATVSVRGWHRHGGVTVISVDEFQRMMRSNRVWAERIRHDPFWVTVAGGRVTELREQRYP
jgi:hypothetical protein